MNQPTSHTTDRILIGLSLAVCVLAGVIAGLSLRQWSALAGAVAFGGVLWRTISTWDDLQPVARLAAGLLGLDLLAGAVAQALVIADEKAGPPNVIGVGLIIATRVVILVAVLFWRRLLLRPALQA